MDGYIAQSAYVRRRSQQVNAVIFVELLDLRRELTLRFAFIENRAVSQALDIVQQRRGNAKRMKDARKAAQKQQLQVAVPAATLHAAIPGVGPRGGLPRTKAPLQKLCRDAGLEDHGTVAQSTERLREFTSMLPKTEMEGES